MLISLEVRHRLNHCSANPEDSTVSIWKSQWETLKKQKPVTLRLGNVHSVEEWCLQWLSVYFREWWFHPIHNWISRMPNYGLWRGEGIWHMISKQVNQLPSFKIFCKPSPVFFSPWTYQEGSFQPGALLRPLGRWTFVVDLFWWQDGEAQFREGATIHGLLLGTCQLGTERVPCWVWVYWVGSVVGDGCINGSNLKRHDELIIIGYCNCIVSILDVWWFEWVECFVSIVLVLRCICCAAAFKKT